MLRTLALGAVLAGCGFEHGVSSSLPPTQGTLFVADFVANTLNRYELVRGEEPALTTTVQLPGALTPIILPQTGELLVGENQHETIARYTTPYDTPQLAGAITGNDLSMTFGKMVMVDDELWVVNPGNSDVDRLAFDSQARAATVGSLPVVNGRGIAFDPVTRDLYITQCCGTDTILHATVDSLHALTTLPPLSGNGLANPHGMWLTPWGELFVVDAGANQVLRFTRDAAGGLTANGAITDGSFATPIDLGITPWGELFVTNQGSGVVSRFLLDEAHTVTPNGTFAVPSANAIAWLALE